jgi:hypothetical protein
MRPHLILAALVLCAAEVLAQQTQTAVPTTFSGTYKWRNEDKSYGVTLVMKKVQTEAGILKFEGIQTYQSGDYKVKVHGTIDPTTFKFSMKESEPSRADTTTAGEYQGKISNGLKKIDAVWTTRGTGNKGDLNLKAVE